MRLRVLVLSGCISVAMAVSAVPATAAADEHMKAYTNAHREGRLRPAAHGAEGEANTIFKDVQADARHALSRADSLKRASRIPT